MALVEKSAADYNGTFAEVSAAAKRSGGFVMSGSVTKTVGAVNTTTNVGITLKRTVAKVALQTAIDPSFADKYAGTLTINSVKTLQSRLAVARRGRGSDTRAHDLQPHADSRLCIGKIQCAVLLFREWLFGHRKPCAAGDRSHIRSGR